LVVDYVSVLKWMLRLRYDALSAYCVLHREPNAQHGIDYGRSVISSHLEKNAETALKMMCCGIGRDSGKMVLPCRPKFPQRDKSFFQGRFGAASIFVQAIHWTST
jgi:hypothetical protein